jgi:hypothetical protein
MFNAVVQLPPESNLPDTKEISMSLMYCIKEPL